MVSAAIVIDSFRVNINLYHSLGKFSRWQTDIFSKIRIWHYLHEMPNPVSMKNKKKYFNMSFAENFTQSAKH